MWSLVPSPLPLLLPLAVPSTILDGASTSSLWHHQRLQRAAQQRGLALARLCAQHEPPQLRHRRRRARALLRPPLLRPVLRVQRTVAPEEVRLPQPLLPEAEQRVDLPERRTRTAAALRLCRGLVGVVGLPRHLVLVLALGDRAPLVADQQHRLREVEGREAGESGDRDDGVRRVELRVAQPIFLAPKHEPDPLAARYRRGGQRHRLSRRVDGNAALARPRCRREDQLQISDRVGGRLVRLAAAQDRSCTRGAQHSLVALCVCRRINQPEVGEPKVEHGARGGTNIAIVKRAAQQHARHRAPTRNGGLIRSCLGRRDRPSCLWAALWSR
mmetsp:Transcript_39405/g.124478  ORF Transcript_39405/g.124478 Transcript_39405/m.124478 type:complete len:329 (-) Transcript_39405:160-1146(-)